MQVAIYGPLRKDGKLKEKLKEAVYLGQFNSEPEFNMFKVSKNEPCVTLDGRTSIVMDVYRMSKEQLATIVEPTKHIKKNVVGKGNKYLRKVINTPYGKSILYYYNNNTAKLKQLANGDWVEYKKMTSIENYL